MARRLRYIPPGGALVEITCRTIQGRLLLRPSTGLNDVTLGVLARAARLASLLIHAYAFLSNHYHLLVTVADAQQLAEFMNYLNSNLAREAGRLVRWREKFWGRRYQAVLVSEEEAAQVGRLSYVLAHGVKEGLVASPLDWPGVHCARALTEGTIVSGHWHDRTLKSKARRKGLPLDPQAFVECEELSLAPLPCWKSLPPDEYRARVQELIAEIEATALVRQEETGKPPLEAASDDGSFGATPEPRAHTAFAAGSSHSGCHCAPDLEESKRKAAFQDPATRPNLPLSCIEPRVPGETRTRAVDKCGISKPPSAIHGIRMALSS